MGTLLEFRRTPDAPACIWPHISPRNPFRWTWTLALTFGRHIEGPIDLGWLWFVMGMYGALWMFWLLAHVPVGGNSVRILLRNEGMWWG